MPALPRLAPNKESKSNLMEFTDPIGLKPALKLARDRYLLPTTLNSEQISEWEEELKRLSVFSARTNHAGYLQAIKDVIESLLQGKSNEATARLQLQQKLAELQYNPEAGGFPGLEDPNIPPARAGTLRDLSSDARTQLVIRTQMRQMANRGYREQGTTPGALFTFPAWELIRIYPRLVPRGSEKSKSPGWPARWREAGGEFHDGRMIALKNDPIWKELGDRSQFDDAIGTDYPPFAFNSGMGWRQVSRETCKKLGISVPQKMERPKPAAPLDDTKISVKQFDPEILRGLREALDVEIKEGYARLKAGSAVRAAPIAKAVVKQQPAKAAAKEIAQSVRVSRSLSIELRNKTQARRAQAVLDTIDKVHGDGELEPIPLNNKLPRGPLGGYVSRTADAVNIGIRATMPADEEFIVTHEVGHWLDHIGIKSPGKFASESADELDGWNTAVRKSAAYQELAKDFTRNRYFLSMREAWARSYAQFIAEESGNAQMLASVDKARSGNFAGWPKAAHWTTEDFAPIRTAIRELFVKLNWMQPQAPAGE